MLLHRFYKGKQTCDFLFASLDDEVLPKWATLKRKIFKGENLCHNHLCFKRKYRIFPAIRRGFRPSRMTSNNLISPMKFGYNTNSTLPKQCQSSRSVLQDGSRTFGLFWKEKTPSYNRRNTVISDQMIK